MRGPEVYATNHHPYFTTVLYGAFAKLGLLLDGNIFYGVALYCLCQMLVMALVLTGVWFYLRRLGLSGRILQGGAGVHRPVPPVPPVRHHHAEGHPVRPGVPDLFRAPL